METIEIRYYDAANAGIRTEQIPANQLAQHPNVFVTVRGYDPSTGSTTKEVRVSDISDVKKSFVTVEGYNSNSGNTKREVKVSDLIKPCYCY